MMKHRLGAAVSENVAITSSLGFYKVVCVLLVVPYIFSIAVLYRQGTRAITTAILLATCFPLAISTYKGIPRLVIELKNKGFCNTNLNAEDDAPKVPEPGSLWACIAYLVYIVTVGAISTKGRYIALFNGVAISISLMTLLGLIDDMVPTSYFTKVTSPVFASIPVFMAPNNYTLPSIPAFNPSLLRFEFLFSCAYYVVCVLLTIFFVNAINIHAGINGLEVGQSVIIALSLLVHNCIEIAKSTTLPDAKAAMEMLERHMMSLRFTLPFLSVNAGLLCYNWYPASTFVGNIYTFMAGALFAAMALVSKSTLMMLLLYIPQMVNFLVSIPQLIGILPCPRFRAPRFNAKTGLLEYTNNYTLLNAMLWALGPMSERNLCLLCLGAQVLCCAGGLVVYHCYLCNISFANL